MTNLDAYARFLTARWDEQEQAAQPAYAAPWRASEANVWTAADDDPDEGPTVYVNGGVYANQNRTANHIALHDPAYVLADLAAKRAVIEEAVAYSPELEHGDNGEWAVEMVVRHLAAPFRDHPDHPANRGA